MNQPDFAIEVALRARTMTTLVVPDAETQVEGGVTLEREEVRPAGSVRPRKTREGVAVDKRVTGHLSEAQEARAATHVHSATPSRSFAAR